MTVPAGNHTTARNTTNSAGGILSTSQQPSLFGPSPYFGPKTSLAPTPDHEPPSSLFRPWPAFRSKYRVSQAVELPNDTTTPFSDDDQANSSFRPSRPSQSSTQTLADVGRIPDSVETTSPPPSWPSASSDNLADLALSFRTALSNWPSKLSFEVPNDATGSPLRSSSQSTFLYPGRSQFFTSGSTAALGSTLHGPSSIWSELSFKGPSSPASCFSRPPVSDPNTAASLDHMSLDLLDPAQPNNAATPSVDPPPANPVLAFDEPGPITSEGSRVQSQRISQFSRNVGKSLYKAAHGSSKKATFSRALKGLGGRPHPRPAQSAWRQYLPLPGAAHRSGARLCTHRDRWVLVYQRYLSHVKRRELAEVAPHSEPSLPNTHCDDSEMYFELYGSSAASSPAIATKGRAILPATSAGGPSHLSPPTVLDVAPAVLPTRSRKLRKRASGMNTTGEKSAGHKKPTKTKVKAKVVGLPPAASKATISKLSPKRRKRLRERTTLPRNSMIGDAGRRMIAQHLGLANRGGTIYSQAASMQELRTENIAQRALIDRQAETIRHLIGSIGSQDVLQYD